MGKRISIPFNSKPYQSIEELGLQSLSEKLLNGYIESSGEDPITVKRLGLDVFTTLSTFKKIDGLFWWQELSILIAVSDGFVYKITNNTGTIVDITGDKLEVDGQVSFAQNGTRLVMANGGRMIYTDGTNNTTYIADSDAPTLVSHIAFLDQWLLANKTGTANFYYADFTGAPTSWLATSVFSAESHPDFMLGLYVNRRIIILPGTQSIEFWGNDGVTPFVRLQGTTSSRGAMSPHSTIFANEVGFYWDDSRRFVRLDGTQATILSTPFDKTINNLTTVNDCISDYIKIQGKHFLKFQFVSENKTFMYDIQGDYWFEWTFWNSGQNTHQRFIGQAYAYARGWNLHVFGSWKDSKIFKMTSTSYSDNGVDIHMERITGHSDLGIQNQEKICYDITLRMRSGDVLSNGVQATALLSWRDNGEQGFSNEREIKLRPSANTQFNHTEYDMGSFETRQWKLKHTDPTPFAVGKVTVNMEALDV
ncbi:MAG: hypothetical protein O2963_00125 [Proteobacteria bacterium]|nr:hypothetical protein [Pseudomonadota bacterium]